MHVERGSFNVINRSEQVVGETENIFQFESTLIDILTKRRKNNYC